MSERKGRISIISASGTAEGDEIRTQKMSNSDFRSFVDKRIVETTQYRSSNFSDEPDETPRDGMAGAPKKKKNSRYESYRKWLEKKDKKMGDKKDVQYRDRADERRKEKNPDYEGIETEKFENVTEESSKYLGGDLEHTHLVKGLDFALLNKHRSDAQHMDDERDALLEQEFQRGEESKLSGGGGAASTSVPSVGGTPATNKGTEAAIAAGKAAPKEEEVHFLTPLGRSLHRLVLNEGVPAKPVDNFMPGRMLFEFDVDADFGSSVPTTLLQSKEECAPTEERLSGLVSRELTERIGKVLTTLREGSRYMKGKSKRKTKDDREVKKEVKEEQKAQPTVPMAALDDDDIFSGVSKDYIGGIAGGSSILKPVGPAITENDELPALQGPAAGPPDGEAQETPEDIESAKAEMLTQEKSEELERKKREELEQKLREKEADYVPDHYAEAYPAFHSRGVSFDMDENSDEEDVSKMDPGTNHSKLKRWDFETEEEWQQHNERREANPKAAYQFGLKMKDGRKNKDKRLKYKDEQQLERANEQKRNQKLDKEWNQIKQIIKKKSEAKGQTAPALDEGETSAKRRKILLKDRE